MQVLGLFAGYSTALFAFTSLVPLMLLHGGSAALNLSLLASDFYAAGARALFFGELSGWSTRKILATLHAVCIRLACHSRGCTCS